MIRSLRYRLLIGVSLAGVIVLSLLGISVYAMMRHALLADFDRSLMTEARVLQGMISQDGNKLSFEFDPQQMPDFLADSRQHFFEVWREDGRVLARSPSLSDQDLPGNAAAATGLVGTTQLPGGQAGRAILISYSPKQDEQDENHPTVAARPVNIAIAAAPTDVYRTLNLLGWMLTTLCAAAVIAMGATLYWVVGRGVQPVRSLADRIESLQETDLRRRLAPDGVPAELAPVVEKLNGLLARLESSFAREKSFTADVAHELRTPLAGLRATLEVCRSRRREPEAYETAVDECRVITDRMTAMVESLLMLARSDAGHVSPESHQVDISEMITESWSLFQHRAESRGLKVSLDMPEQCMASTDPEMLRIVLHNVVDNAVSYVNERGSLRIGLQRRAGDTTVEIANTGSHVSKEDAPRLFERFWRGNAARTEAGIHCGLGLALAQRLMNLLGGEMSVKTDTGQEFLVSLRVPDNRT